MVSPEIKSLVLVGSGGFGFQRLHLHARRGRVFAYMDACEP